MTAALTNWIRNLLAEATYPEAEVPAPEGAEVVRLMNYEEAGLMTADHGLVVETEDGHEYQITIVQVK